MSETRAATVVPRVISAWTIGVLVAGAPMLAWAQQSTSATGTAARLPEFREVVKAVLPAVVSITATSDKNVNLNGDAVEGFGSGVIIDGKRGVILTNNHVVEGAAIVVVTLQDAREFRTDDIVRDPKSDVAIVRLKSDDADTAELPSAELGDSDNAEIGDWVLAMGSPFQLRGTVTSGIISAKGRTPPELRLLYKDFIQTDAAINPGNSGGPLVSLDGKIIGINTAIRSSTGTFGGIGFSIPSNLLRPIVEQLDKYGRVKRSYLGVSMDATTASFRRENNLASGVIIRDLTSEDTPAAKAGLKPEDVVLSVDSRPVTDTKELQDIITNTPAGATVEMKVFRGGEILDIPVELEEQPESFGPQTILARRGPRIPDGESFDSLGFSVAETPLGLLITDVESGSRADVENLRPGDRIVKSEQKAVTTLEEFKKSIDGVDVAKDGVILKVAKRDGSEPLVVLGRDER